jgi:signal peptidase I
VPSCAVILAELHEYSHICCTTVHQHTYIHTRTYSRKNNNQKSESPVVVVLSGSMEPAFQRGDILFLDNSVHAVHVGDVVVFKIKDRDIPIVHRILKVHEKPNGTVELLTKGDNNRVDDRGLYAPGQLWLQREDILGKAVGTLRYVGMVTIALNDYPVLKYVLVGMMGLFVLTSKEN